MRRVGITGAEGHIGSALLEGLADRYKIVPITLTTQAFESTVVDLSDATATTGIFDGLDAVIHLAADPSPTGLWESMLQNNISASYNVLEEARRAGVKKVVFASTNHTPHGYTMGGSPDELDLEKNFMLRIDDPPNPTSLYGVSKLTGEQLGRFFSREYGLQFVALKPVAAMTQQLRWAAHLRTTSGRCLSAFATLQRPSQRPLKSMRRF